MALVIVGALATATYFLGKHNAHQVVDSTGKKVKGNFLSTDGATATLQSKK